MVAELLRFHLHSIDAAGLVCGRNDELEIPIGSVFTSVVRTRIKRIMGRIECESIGTAAQIHLTVREVHWYGRVVEAVPAGHTAGLVLDGAGFDCLAALLQSCPPDEVFSLVGRAGVAG